MWQSAGSRGRFLLGRLLGNRTENELKLTALCGRPMRRTQPDAQFSVQLEEVAVPRTLFALILLRIELALWLSVLGPRTLPWHTHLIGRMSRWLANATGRFWL